MPIYNSSPGVKIVMGVAIVASLAGMWKTGFDRYREDNPYAGMPDDFQSAMNDMGLQHSYTGEINTEIQNMLLAYDFVSSADANVITSNGEVYSITVTLAGDGWKNYTDALADKIRDLYPGTRVSFYDTDVNIIYSE